MYTEEEKELAWAAGFFDGEGHTRYTQRSLQMSLPQIDREPLDRFQQAVKGGKVYGPYKVGAPNRRPIFNWEISNSNEVKRIANLLLPYLSSNKSNQIRKAIEIFAQRSFKIGPQATHCMNGHEWTPENTYFYPERNQRKCKACSKLAYERTKEPKV